MNRIYIILCAFFFSLCMLAQEPAVEIRAAWLTTNWKLDWPRKGKTVEEQKAELEKILDELQEQNFNLILFQVRAQGKTFYHSLVEDRSPYFNGANGFDPLAFAIEACHQRGMECHAWIPAFPVEQIKMSRRGKILEKRPDFYKRNGSGWFLDPGRRETQTRLELLVTEIVSKYDVDGIHLDYIRYPENSKTFQDNDTYRLYGKGKNKNDWRRENVNRIVSAVYDTVKSIKNWVQVSSSPIGKYKAIKPSDGWTAYEAVFQDAGRWMQEGKHDLLFPMMYYKEADFYPYVDKWIEVSNNRPIVPGLGAYQLEEKERNWNIEDIDAQIQFSRDKNIGQAYFRVGQIIDNKKGLKETVRKYYKYPAKLPPLTWLNDTIPSSPVDFRVFKDDEGLLRFEWEAPKEGEKFTYNIYVSSEKVLDPNKAEGLLVANLRSNSYSFEPSVGEYGYYYYVTASDRYHNESESAESVFFVHSENVY